MRGVWRGGGRMNRKFLLITSVIITALFCSEYAFAGAWTVPKYKVWGEYYMKWDYSKDAFEPDRKLRSTKSSGTKNFRSWEFVQAQTLEYGATDWLTLLTGLEFKEAHYKEYERPQGFGPFTRKHHGLTNVKLGARWRLTDKPAVVSVQGKYFIYPGYGLSHGDDPNFNENQPGIGTGDDAFELRALVGKTFDLPIKYKIPCYIGAETGYRWRNRHVAHDIPYFIEGGFWPRPWLLIKTELDGYWVNGGTGSIKSDYGVWRIGGVYQVFGDSVLREGAKLFNIEFQYGMTLWGKNTNAAQEWVLKVQTQF